MSVYRLLQFSDPHLFVDRKEQMRGVCTYDTLMLALSVAQKKHGPADAILVTGDIAQDENEATYEVFRECFANLGVPVFCLPGNHDAPGYMREILNKDPFHFCGSIAMGNWLIPMLDTHQPGEASGWMVNRQLAELDELLGSHPDKNILLCMHHHPIASGSRWLDTVPLRNAADLWAIVEKHDHVRCLLWGHVHQSFEERMEGLLLLATPSTCRQFLPNANEFALDEERPPAYRWLDLHPDGTIVTAVEWCH